MTYPKVFKLAKQNAIAKKSRASAKKKRTPKQIAATKKLVALNKKRASARKKVGTSQTAKSRATKKAPSKRLKQRRSLNTKKGYYPNPILKGRYVLKIVPTPYGLKNGTPTTKAYWTGTGWDTSKSKAVIYPSLKAVKGEASHLPTKYKPGRNYSLASDNY